MLYNPACIIFGLRNVRAAPIECSELEKLNTICSPVVDFYRRCQVFISLYNSARTPAEKNFLNKTFPVFALMCTPVK